MKSVKSLFAIFAIATLSFGCAAVTETPAPASEQPEVITTPADDAVFSGHDMKPVLEKPKI